MTTPNDPLTSRADFGICVPNYRPGASPLAMIAAAETAERLGWGSLWTTDHLLVDHSERAAEYAHIYEALSVLAWLGGQTTSVRLGISVLVVPMRNAVVLAKELATIDALTNGRLIVGVGIGWNEIEFGNVGAGDVFRQRGAFLEETVAMWRHLWGGNDGPFEGRFHSFSDARFSPLPVQGADLPIWIGAHADKAIERVGRIAEGYQSTFAEPDDMARRAEIVRRSAAAAGRPMPTIASRVRARVSAADQGGRILGGESSDMAALLDGYADAGVSQIALDFAETDADVLVKHMERFDREVISARADA